MEKGTFTDPRDGKVYRTVKIGRQIWMAENLNYNANGSQYYNNNPANGQKCGLLYNWETAKKACPPGWHLPSNTEWEELVNFAGGYQIAGEKLKAVSNWFNNGNGSDEYGFAALPGGYGHTDGRFLYGGYSCGWWSATESNTSLAYRWGIVCNYAGVNSDGNVKIGLCSVRCVQD